MSSISFIEIRTAHIRYVKRTYTANTTRGVLENITISGRKLILCWPILEKLISSFITCRQDQSSGEG